MGNIIFGIIFIVGGLSGAAALRGTGSPLALAAVGLVFLIIGFVQLGSRKPAARSRSGGRSSRGGTARQRRSRR